MRDRDEQRRERDSRRCSAEVGGRGRKGERAPVMNRGRRERERECADGERERWERAQQLKTQWVELDV